MGTSLQGDNVGIMSTREYAGKWTTQFTKAGWRFVAKGAGSHTNPGSSSGWLRHGGTYVGYVDTDGSGGSREGALRSCERRARRGIRSRACGRREGEGGARGGAAGGGDRAGGARRSRGRA